MRLSAPEQLSADHDLTEFDCGNAMLNSWLRSRALSNQRDGFAAVRVSHLNGVVVAYYGLAPSAVVATDLSRSVRTGQLPDPVPCFLLGQLAVDQRYAGIGIGAAMLIDAYERTLQAAHLVGGRALIVKAYDEDAAMFWRRHNFKPTRADPLLLCKSIQNVAASFAAL